MALPILHELLLSTLLVVLVIPVCFFVTKSRRSSNPFLPTDWPIVGMLPGLIANRHSLHDYAATVLAASGHNFKLQGPPATSVQYLVTSSPANVRHIFTTNFANYVKGEELAAVLGILGGTIVAADGESWRRQRETIHHVLTRPRLVDSLSRCCHNKVAMDLVPLLSHMASTRATFDMEDLLGRLVFDVTVMAVFGTDPFSLANDMPPVQVAAALDTLMEVALQRMSLPVSCWKTLRWLNVGQERRLAQAESVLYNFVAESIRRSMAAGSGRDQGLDGKFWVIGPPSQPVLQMHKEFPPKDSRLAPPVAAGDAATAHAGSHILSYYISSDLDPDFLDRDREPTDFLHRTFINFMVAVRDPMGSTLSWLIYNLAMNPHVVLGIREELAPVAACKASGSTADEVVFEPDETKDLVYTRAAMFESLRLYPIAPLERKTAVADDVLPSGHKVRAGDTILISTYSMGRLEQVWGENCQEYRPERWLSRDGDKLRHVPSHEFIAFNTGPRACLGKNISVALVTSIAATVVWNFDVEVLESHAVKPKLSLILQMKNGLMAKVKKRSQGKVPCE